MTRLEAGAIHLRLEPCDIQDVIGTTLEHMGARLGKRPVRVEVPQDLELVSMDFALFDHALINLLDNAIKVLTGRYSH